METHTRGEHTIRRLRNRYCTENGKGISLDREATHYGMGHTTERKDTRRGDTLQRGDTHAVGHVLVRGGNIYSKETTRAGITLREHTHGEKTYTDRELRENGAHTEWDSHGGVENIW